MGSSFKPTIRDVAERAGVSLATVSYVLSGRHGGSTRISEPTKARVVEAAKSLGYVPNHAARGMRRGRTDTVAVVVENLDSAWDRQLAEVANRVLPEHGYRVVVLLGQEAWRNFMLSGGADGAILGFSTETPEEDHTLRDLADRGVAQVVVSQFQQPDGFDVVSVDAEAGIAQAAAYLAARHSRIAVLHRGGPAPGPRGTRLGLFRQAMADLGVELDENLVRATHGSWRESYEVTGELLKLADPPTAFFTTADLEALCVSGSVTAAELRIPEDVEIIGVETSDLGHHSDPPLSSVGPDPLVGTVVDLLIDRLEGRTPTNGRLVPAPWKLHHRGTTVAGAPGEAAADGSDEAADSVSNGVP